MRRPTNERLGDLLVQSLTEIRDGLRGRRGKLTIKTVEIPDPLYFSAAAVHKLRDQLGLSQAMFAKLIGISRMLVEAWEAGSRKPSSMACRLLDAISTNPSRYVRRWRRVA